ncbi:MAG: hypothetical protein WD276_10075 [Actinomycetota bacterium]
MLPIIVAVVGILVSTWAAWRFREARRIEEPQEPEFAVVRARFEEVLHKRQWPESTISVPDVERRAA